ncbi:lyase family protein [Devosia sp.]|uniref:lyase family protein n=1 Tax=Devosia sp. TaxID=1871048 RepID=UPI0025EC0ACE|nr:lyase family protein [Devosia sp.]MCR6636008.1 lyase family protein [Devosia sp.]
MTALLSALTGDPEIEDLLSDQAQLGAMLAFERALAEASADCGFVSAEAAGAIVAAAASFEPNWAELAAGMARDGVVVPALVKQLKAGVPDEHRPALHKGATSQDVIDTALMLQVAKVLGVYETRLSSVLATLEELAHLHGDKPLMAHTRMQGGAADELGREAGELGRAIAAASAGACWDAAEPACHSARRTGWRSREL